MAPAKDDMEIHEAFHIFNAYSDVNNKFKRIKKII